MSKQENKKKSRFNAKGIIALSLLLLFAGTYLVSLMNHKKPADHNNVSPPVSNNNTVTGSPGTNTEPQFVKQGELNFLSASDRKVIKKIAIEIADTEARRSQGLMYRKSMADTNGMLFLFAVSEPQNFWMHNTYLPLDIIYVNENREIVSIARNCKPLSDKDIPSVKNAQYVVEVNAGFCDKYKIKEGDFISF